jgi:hypothetical protein
MVRTYRPAVRKPATEELDPYLDISGVDVEGIEISRATESPVSPITSGFIKLKGLLRHMTWQYSRRRSVLYLKIDGQQDSHIYGYTDESASSLDESAWIIQIQMIRGDAVRLSGMGLILRCNDDGVFQRIGYFCAYGKTVLDLLSRGRRATINGIEDTEEKSFAELSLQSEFEGREADAEGKGLTQEAGDSSEGSEEQSIIII